MNPEHCISVCNRLLRGERSAVETYDKVIQRFGDKAEVTELSRIRQEHVESVAALERNVLSMGGLIDLDSGIWGITAQATQETANMFGLRAALGILRTGENAGKEDYHAALEDEEVMPECKDLITSALLPKLLEHIATLDLLGKQPA